VSTLAASLVRPQRLRRAAAADPDAALLADVLALAPRLAADTPEAAALRGALADALAASAEGLRQRAEAGAARAMERLRGWLDGLAAPVVALGAELTGIDDPAAVAGRVEEMVGRLAAAAEGLDADAIRPHLELLLDVLRTELRVDERFVEAQAWALLDGAAARIRALPPGTPAEMDGRREAVRVLHRLRRRFWNVARIPTLDAGQLAGILSAQLRRLGAGVAARKAACAGRGASAVAGALGSVAEAVPFGGALSFRSVGAAASSPAPRDRFAWYASWLLRERRREWWAQFIPVWGDTVWVTADRTRVEHRTVFGDDVTLHTGTGLEWFNAPLFSTGNPRFRVPDPGRLENTARALAYLPGVAEIVAHIASLEEGDYASNAVHLACNFAHLIYRGVRDEPLPGWAEWLLWRGLGTGLASLEKIHTNVNLGNGLGLWITLFGPDFGEMVLYNYLAWLAYDVTLASITLYNHDPDATPKPENYKVAGEWTDLFTAAGLTLLVNLQPRRHYSLFGAGSAGWQVLLWLGGSVANGLVAGLLGTLVSGAWARDLEWSELHIRMAVSLRRSFTYFWPWLYLWREGDTDDGHYNPDASGSAFTGYPAKATSPYKMPYAPGKSCFLGQGNQGLFSHQLLNPASMFETVYAYDFSLDGDEEILASRPGTVVDYFDWVPDNKNPPNSAIPPSQEENDIRTDAATVPGNHPAYDTWNFIAIRHDVDDAGNALAPNPDHDRGPGGTVVTTYALYGHGRYGSVRAAFNARGVAPDAIIGTAVKRGHLIMKAGSTGVSFHNHVHLDVRKGPAAGSPIRWSTLGQTIPFVFSDCREDDGRPRRLNFYSSSNTRVG
jgi:hypothetical protein